MQVKLKAPAKVNLRLIIGEKRLDGYHNINSIFAAVDICDHIEIKKTGRGPVIVCPEVKNNNIAIRTVEVFRETYGFSPDVEITIKKTIPIGRGLGGGSSDAAAILIGLHRMFGLNLENPTDLGKKIGSDVPFFFKGGIARVTGRGEIIQPIPFIKLNLLIVSPPFQVSTAWAYKILDESNILDPKFEGSASFDITNPQTFSNTFERIIFDRYPNLYKIKNWLLESGAKAALLSGSGSAIFGVFEDSGPEDIPFQDHELFPCRTINWGVV